MKLALQVCKNMLTRLIMALGLCNDFLLNLKNQHVFSLTCACYVAHDTNPNCIPKVVLIGNFEGLILISVFNSNSDNYSG